MLPTEIDILNKGAHCKQLVSASLVKVPVSPKRDTTYVCKTEKPFNILHVVFAVQAIKTI